MNKYIDLLTYLLIIDGKITTVDGLLNEDRTLYSSHNDVFTSVYTQQMRRQPAVMVTASAAANEFSPIGIFHN